MEDSTRQPLGEGEGDGVKVGEVLLEVDDVPDGGRFRISFFFGKCPLLLSGSGAVEPLVLFTMLIGDFFCSDKLAAFLLCAAICERTLSALPPATLPPPPEE